MKEKNRDKHADLGWGTARQGRGEVPKFESKEEAMAYLRANPPRPQDVVVALVIVGSLLAVMLSPLFIQVYKNNLIGNGDNALRGGRYEEAIKLYKQSTNVALANDVDKINDKIALAYLYEKKYDLAAEQLNELIMRHLVRLTEPNSHRSRKNNKIYSIYSEANTLRYQLGNYNQVLALQGKLNEIQPYESKIWNVAFDSIKNEKKRHQIQKNILDTTQGSLRHRGYTSDADALSAKRDEIAALPETEQEAKNVALITSLMPPQPYNNPVFSDDAIRN